MATIASKPENSMPAAAKLTPIVAKPDHVPDHLVYDFDYFYDPALATTGYDRILDLAQNTPPIFWSPRNGGIWVLNGHRAVYNAQRNTEVFSNSPVKAEAIMAMNAQMPEGRQKILIPSPITYDPPLHGMFRKPIQGVFSPKSMLALKDDIRALAVELVEAVKPNGGCDFLSEIAEPLPVTVFLKMFGLPTERAREFRDLVTDHLASQSDPDVSMVSDRMRGVADALKDTILEKQKNPGSDILSLLWQSEFDGRPADLHDLESYGVMLFIAGLDTVFNGMAFGAIHLANNPDLQAELRANPKLIPEAAEEILRRYSFTVPPRFVNRDVEFEGVTMKQGEKALMYLPAADLDASEFPEPGTFNMKRENNVHIAFGAGPHRCLGSHLARIELQVLYEEMLARLPEFRLDPEKPVTYHGGHVIGPESVHLLW
jgi:cytochrome P450